jgi:hypothetical protein
VLLELLDLSAYGRLGEKELGSRLRERQIASRGLEGEQWV